MCLPFNMSRAGSFSCPVIVIGPCALRSLP